MTINFITKGKKDVSQIHVRIKDTNLKIDATSKTGLSVLKENFVKGKIVLTKTPKSASAKTKNAIVKHNLQLTDIETKLTTIKRQLLHAFGFRKEHEQINSKWIYNVINPENDNKTKIPNELVLYFDYYLNAKKDDLRESTLKKIVVIQNRLKAFENDTNAVTYLQEVNHDFVQRFKDWSNTKAYHKNTFIKTIKVITTVCKHAKSKHDVQLHPHTSEVTKGKEMKYLNSFNVHLSFDELKQIENTTFKIDKEDIARDWLLISCYTAQRISDFMRFNVEDITILDDNKFLDIRQEKTDAPVLVYLNDVVLKILKKYNGNFPPLYSQKSKESNEITYNRLVKIVCKKSGITNVVKGQLKNPKTNRVEVKELPKYKFVSSHIGRRSFATNYYGEISTSLLLSATGHKTEKQFLAYVSKPPKQSASALAKAMKSLSNEPKAPMKVIKNVSNK